jgi:hypothetical protein
MALQNSTSGNSALFDISSTANNSQAITVQTAGNGDAVGAYNNGNGRALYALATSSAETMMGTNLGTGYALRAANTGTSAGTSRAAWIQGGMDVMGKTAGTGNFALWVTDVGFSNIFNVRDDGHVGIGTTSPGNKLSVIETNTIAAIFANNASSTSVSGAHGIWAVTSNPSALSSGLFGESTGAGPSIHGYKGVNSGPAGRFEINLATATADALFATTLGSGAAVHAASGPGNSSALSLLVDAGHIKAVGTTANVSSTNVSGGFAALTSISPAGNDVRGSVSFVTSVTGFAANNFADVTITFQKPYAVIPTVVVTPVTDLQGLSFMVTNPTTTGFTIRTYRSVNASSPVSVPNATFKFNYFVIE